LIYYITKILLKISDINNFVVCKFVLIYIHNNLLQGHDNKKKFARAKRLFKYNILFRKSLKNIPKVFDLYPYNRKTILLKMKSSIVLYTSSFIIAGLSEILKVSCNFIYYFYMKSRLKVYNLKFFSRLYFIYLLFFKNIYYLLNLIPSIK